MREHHKKGLIIAPGLETYLSAITINKEKPSYIAFITDELTSELIKEIIKKTELKSIEWKKFFVKQYVSTTETMQEFFKAFYWLTDEKNASEIIIDATNTLKPRAIALYMASSFIDVFKEVIGEKSDIRLDYVNCPFSLKGKPIKGKEELIRLDEPTDTLSYTLAIYGVSLFNNYAYASAKKIFGILEEKSSGEQYLLYSGLKSLSNAFSKWDKFQLNQAIKELEDAIIIFKRIKTYLLIKKLLPQLEEKRSILKKTEQKFDLHQIIDLFQNANRRIEENRFDDALARFYCCLEMISRYRLGKYGIDPSKPDYNKLPKSCIEEFKKKNKNILPKEIELKKGYELLYCLNDPLGKEVEKNKKMFLGLIGLRNLSILAHGTKPISEENIILFKEKLAEKLLFDLLEQENVKKEKILNLHLHIKLPIAIKEFYRQI